MILNGLRRRARDKLDHLMLQSDTESLKSSQITSESPWQKTPVPNLVRYGPSRVFFARIRVEGKRIRRSLKTKGASWYCRHVLPGSEGRACHSVRAAGHLGNA